jgi:hypothetical protein
MVIMEIWEEVVVGVVIINIFLEGILQEELELQLVVLEEEVVLVRANITIPPKEEEVVVVDMEPQL